VAKGWTFLSEEVLRMHAELLLEAESSGRPGMVVECGVAKAGSSIVMAAAKRIERCLHLFDTFTGLPPPSNRDGQDVGPLRNPLYREDGGEYLPHRAVSTENCV
jgi:hypothetical protein